MFPCYISNFLEELSSLSHSVVPLFLCIIHLKRLYLFFLFFEVLRSDGYIFPFLFCPLLLFFSQLFLRPPQTAILPFCISCIVVWGFGYLFFCRLLRMSYSHFFQPRRFSDVLFENFLLIFFVLSLWDSFVCCWTSLYNFFSLITDFWSSFFEIFSTLSSVFLLFLFFLKLYTFYWNTVDTSWFSYIHTYILFQIILHYRLFQDICYSSLSYTVNHCCFLHTYFFLLKI